MIVAVDFDDTLRLKNGKPNVRLIKSLIDDKILGHKVILHTTRTGKSLLEAVRFCNAYGLYFDDVYGNKPFADFYIDDKAVNPFKD